MTKNIEGWSDFVKSGRRGRDEGAIPSRAAAQDVFPGLGLALASGLLLGAALGAGLALFNDLNSQSIAGYSAGGALVGLILGMFLGLSRAVWRPGVPVPVAEARPALAPAPEVEAQARLWDSWLDTGHDLNWMAPTVEPAVAVSVPQGERPRVQPRVVSAATGESVLLHDEIAGLIERGETGAIAIVGGPGSGKTTAIQHLEIVLPPWAEAKLLDEPEIDKLVTWGNRLVVYTTTRTIHPGCRAVYRLASWTRDDRIEYLLKAHWSRCASVMERLKQSGDEGFLGGIPELWTVVLDRMAADRSVTDLRTALFCELDDRLHDPALRRHVGHLCLNAVGKSQVVIFGEVEALTREPEAGAEAEFVELHRALEEDRALVRLLRHPPVQLLLAAEWLTENLVHRETRDVLASQLPRGLVFETGRLLAGSPEALETLKLLLAGHDRRYDPMAVSLLHAAGVNWQPARNMRSDLLGAYLAGIRWIGVNLRDVTLIQADLEQALLWRANLENALAGTARLSGADLSDANMKCCIATSVDLSRAVMRKVRADGAVLIGANLAQADLGQASLRDVWLEHAVLNGARFRDADLRKASLVEADIEDADFTGANLEDACLKGLKLRLAQFGKARFGGADLSSCDLEDMELDAPDFHDANLQNAIMTGSIMPQANLLGANLGDAGLAMIQWPGACLRDANLQGASFHLGTTRSGLVQSPIACEGSRTGFYTDEYGEQDFKSPEEIRKANLRGADLRGADVYNADFYLVDLREALYDSHQAEHFRRCGAILHHPAE
jgi:uncharacterized protein YjbI with pentapeptide repeats